MIRNFNNTGQDAIKIVFKSDYVANLQGGDEGVPSAFGIFLSNLVINDEIIPTKAETLDNNNDNKLYLFYDYKDFPYEIDSGNKVKDTLDVNKNRSIDDTVLMTKSKVLVTVVDSIQSKKYIRSVEPVGTSTDPTKEMNSD